tara:strand:+ start:26305 stop:26976 length:672 start_codon:yes stop_codon:yes gene_type:complete
MNRILILNIFLHTCLFSLNTKEKFIINFIDARYSGDTTFISNVLSEKFTYEHIPFIGLNLTTEYVEGNLIVTGFITEDTLQNQISIGDTIHEIDNFLVDSLPAPIRGPENKLVKIVYTRNGDSTFSSSKLKLKLLKHDQNKTSFIQDIINYNNNWYEYDLEIIDIISKKSTFFVYYHWEGSKTKAGQVYHLFAMELIQKEKNSNLIKKIQTLWSEKQFLDQFK